MGPGDHWGWALLGRMLGVPQAGSPEQSATPGPLSIFAWEGSSVGPAISTPGSVYRGVDPPRSNHRGNQTCTCHHPISCRGTMSDKGTWANFMRLPILLVTWQRLLFLQASAPEGTSSGKPSWTTPPKRETLPITCHLDDFLPNIYHEPGLAMNLSVGLLPIT